MKNASGFQAGGVVSRQNSYFLPKTKERRSTMASTIMVMAMKVQRKAEEVKGLSRMRTPKIRVRTAPIMEMNQYCCFMRHRSVAHWTLLIPLARVSTP